MPATMPGAAVYGRLNGYGSLGLTGATNLFEGPLREDQAAGIPVGKAAFVLAQQGTAPAPYLGGESFWRALVNVRVRSERDDFAGGQTLAQGVLAALHLASLSGYVACYATNSLPGYLGVDPTDHHQFLVTVELWYKE